MLRKILMALGLIVAFLPYAGIPRAIDALIYPVVGLSIFFLLIFSKKPKIVVRPNMDVEVSMQKSEVVKPSIQSDESVGVMKEDVVEQHHTPQVKMRVRAEHTQIHVRHDRSEESKISVLRESPDEQLEHEKVVQTATIPESIDGVEPPVKKPARRRKKLSEVLSDTGQEHPST